MPMVGSESRFGHRLLSVLAPSYTVAGTIDPLCIGAYAQTGMHLGYPYYDKLTVPAARLFFNSTRWIITTSPTEFDENTRGWTGPVALSPEGVYTPFGSATGNATVSR